MNPSVRRRRISGGRVASRPGRAAPRHRTDAQPVRGPIISHREPDLAGPNGLVTHLPETDVDVVVVGGGIVGMATAMALARGPARARRDRAREGARARPAPDRAEQRRHPLGHLLPAGLARRRCSAARASADAASSAPSTAIAVRAVRQGDRRDRRRRSCRALEALQQRALANGVPGVRRIGRDELRELEPAAAGVAALHSPTTAIVDYRRGRRRPGPAGRRPAADPSRLRVGGDARRHEPGQCGRATARPGAVRGARGRQLRRPARRPGRRGWTACEPAAADRAVPRRVLRCGPAARDLVRGLIYPVPDPAFPFLGVHLTRGVHGDVHAGPNAVPALAREGYAWRDVGRARPVRTRSRSRGPPAGPATLADRGSRRCVRSLSAPARSPRAVARLLPGRPAGRPRPGAGGRPRPGGGRDGRLVDDFWIAGPAGPCTC